MHVIFLFSTVLSMIFYIKYIYNPQNKNDFFFTKIVLYKKIIALA